MSRQKSRTEEVYDAIVDKLYAGEYRPGDVLDRQAISKETDVSVGTVLIAINVLEADGFVETLPRKGTLVRTVGFDEVYGQLLTREAFECEAARIYRGQPIVDNWPRLLPLVTELDALSEYSARSIHLDGEFHTELIRLTRVPLFIENYRKIMKLSTFFSFLHFTPGLTQTERDSHVDLLQALRTSDPDEAERAIRSHIRRGRDHFFRWPAD